MPGEQTEQTVSPLREHTRPNGEEEQALRPCDREKLPAAHAVANDKPLALTMLPAGENTHALIPVDAA